MSRITDRKQRRSKIKRRSRHQVRGTTARPRLAVFRSLRHLWAETALRQNYDIEAPTDRVRLDLGMVPELRQVATQVVHPDAV